MAIIVNFKFLFSFRMVRQTIPQMHRQLEDLSQFFMKQTDSFSTTISLHEGRFTPEDLQQFRELIDDLKNESLRRITAFFDGKLKIKTSIYQTTIDGYVNAGESVEKALQGFRDQLSAATIQLKEQQNRKQNLLDHFSKKYSEHVILKRAWVLMNNYKHQKQQARLLDQRMDNIYKRNLLKKAFFPWRTLTYKEGYENTVKRQTERDILNIHEQYQSIIDILKTKISQTDEVIKIKKAAKGQFAFALSKNLLKTISNLSLEVMSLNQMSLRDGEVEEHSTRQFMQSVDNVIKEKLNKVRQYKRGLVEVDEENSVDDKVGEDGKKKKRITFV